MNYIQILLFALIIAGCGSDPVEEETEIINPPPPPPVFELPEVENKGYDFTDAETAGWDMIWEEGFSTNLSQWDIWNGGAFNNELQLYRSGNLYVENDYLYIRQKKESATGATNPFDSAIKSFTHTSGRIETKEKFGPKKVGGTLRYAARLKMPEGDGLWPAFWSYDDPWPTQGEIDVMEFRGNFPNEFKTNFFYGTQANQVLTNSNTLSTAHQFPNKITEEFHVYELVWTEDALEISFDGEVVKTYTNSDSQYVDDLFDKNQNIVLNLAVGGDFFSNLDASKIPSESYMIVDWVKVFRK